jgi:hypothetical protein
MNASDLARWGTTRRSRLGATVCIGRCAMDDREREIAYINGLS